jgi:gamma-glutamylcyclotransferase (GGCT)/AIG2-like uncharacterized protein YtfP
MTALLFVYGSLKRGGELHHELAELQARFLGLAKIQAELFHIKGKSWPGAFPTTATDCVQGELYRMSKPAETLKKLDEVEECNRGLFVRKLVDAWAGNRKVKAWVYFFNREEEKASRIASGNF